MPLSSGNNFTVSTASLDGLKIDMDFGTGPMWLAHNGPVASTRAGDIPNTLRFSLIADKAGEGKAEPVTVTLQNLSGGIDHKFIVTPGYLAPSLSSSGFVTLHAAADYNVPSITITGTSPGGTTLEGPAWLTYSGTNTAADNFSYTVKLNPSKSGFPTSVPTYQSIKLINKTDPDKSTTVEVSFSEANAWVASDLANYDENSSDGYRVNTNGKTMTVSFYSMFAAPTLSPDYDGSYCNSQNGGNSWLNSSKLIRTEIVNNRRKYTYNVAVNRTSGMDAAYQLHRAVMNIKHNGSTVKSYIIWRGASYVSCPAGGGSPYYTAIRKGNNWWAPFNAGATRVAQANDGRNKIVAGAGGIYQWGRDDATNHDGKVVGHTASNTAPRDNIFYCGNAGNSWMWVNYDLDYWSKGFNQPCQKGYRVPTIEQLKSIGNATNWDAGGGLFKVDVGNGFPPLILPAAGVRSSGEGYSSGLGTKGRYWSRSIPSGAGRAANVGFTSDKLYQYADGGANGFSVRCVR
eukprot:MONOS_16749.1-p1 / transcript=MONOS_16749.1 / gene=MONOS_16749 / organism=Monocercomonoides_exilis_PA203 / gene_product=unspecified product / transcript_product=unspecified product / location=Mono_scaffold02141:360-1904(+) / protein_length=515 / sequence_SO=supercontig / SO=protein_coding / is_pseudo=false